MLNRMYKLIITLSLLIAGLSLIPIVKLPVPWNAFFSVLAGGAMSLFASMLIQSFASFEQQKMIKAITFDVKGITKIPDAFTQIKWIAHATKVADKNGNKSTKWYLSPLTKLGSPNPKLTTCSYSLKIPNLIDELINYNCTFVGLIGCVIGILTRENETASTIIFNTDVPDAGIFFGSAYLTDWCGDRIHTLAIVGTGKAPELENLPSKIVTAFEHWYTKNNWDTNLASDAILRQKEPLNKAISELKSCLSEN